MNETWQHITLGDAITLKRGYDLPTSLRDAEGNIPVVSSAGITGHHFEAKAQPPGIVTGRYGTTGLIFYLTEPFWPLNTTLYVVDFKGNYPLFVYFLLQTIDFDKYSGKTGVPGVNRNELHQIPIYLPPLEEQRKIAAILSTWDEAIGLVEQLIAALGRRKQALMQLLLTGAVRFEGFEGEWEALELADCSIGKPQYGANASAIDFDPELPRYIRITDLSDDGRLYAEGKVSIELDGNERYVLKDNDFLFARSGATVGKTYLYQRSDGLAIYAGYLIKFVINENKLIAQYLKHFVQSPIYYEWIKNTLRAGAQPNINAQEYASLPLELPPTVEQKHIAEIFNTSDDFINLYREHANKLQEQKRGLMQQLLTGAVRV